MYNDMIRFQEVSFSYPKRNPIIQQMSFSIQKGESVGIVGANGVGKSTLLKLLVGLELPTQGTIYINDKPMTQKSLPALRKQLGYIFQDANSQLFSNTVYEDVAFGPKNYGFSSSQIQEKTAKALSLVHIETLKDRPVYQLSGGEKKLASIASVLSMEPEILLMDEPSVALDPWNRRNLIHILQELSMTKIIASHDLDFILDTCNRCILLSQKGICFDGKTSEVLSNQALLEANRLELPLSLYHRK